MELEFKKIENKMERYNLYSETIMWDTKRTFSEDDQLGIEWLISTTIGVYLDNEPVALGGIKLFYENKEKVAYLSAIVNPKYRRKGIADRLLEYMLSYCKSELNINKVKVKILIQNKASINQIEKNDFEFESFNDKILTFSKDLK